MKKNLILLLATLSLSACSVGGSDDFGAPKIDTPKGPSQPTIPTRQTESPTTPISQKNGDVPAAPNYQEVKIGTNKENNPFYNFLGDYTVTKADCREAFYQDSCNQTNLIQVEWKVDDKDKTKGHYLVGEYYGGGSGGGPYIYFANEDKLEQSAHSTMRSVRKATFAQSGNSYVRWDEKIYATLAHSTFGTNTVMADRGQTITIQKIDSQVYYYTRKTYERGSSQVYAFFLKRK